MTPDRSWPTLNELWFQRLDADPARPVFLVKREGAYRAVPAETFATAGREISLGLVALGLEQGDRVALIAPTRLEWQEADFGILGAALVTVPVYPTLPALAMEYILENAGVRAVFVADAELAEKIRPWTKERGIPVIAFTPVEGTMTLDALRERGRALGDGEPGLYRDRAARVHPDDLATLIYTSGTTGVPKAVMLTHANIASNVVTAVPLLTFHPTDIALAFLPLSHILERMVEYALVHAGATIAFAESMDTVADNLREVHPTILAAVPRLYEKIINRSLETARAGGAFKLRTFLWARKVGEEHSLAVLEGRTPGPGLRLKNALADRLVFAKLRARTGGRLRILVSGGAPLPPEISLFFHAAGMPILQGYGLTETSPVIAVQLPDAYRLGTTGPPIPSVEVRIAEDGEILARGPNVMKGYFGQPEETAEVLRDGWFHTGDIGHLDEAGHLVITDRKKDLIVTAGGKNVAPQPIENALKTDRYIAEAVVLGDKKPYLVALLVPDPAHFGRLAAARGFPTDLAKAQDDPRVVEFFLERVKRHQKDAASFESIKKVALLDHELTVAGGELTPTLKVKRRVIEERFADRIAALYDTPAQGD